MSPFDELVQFYPEIIGQMPDRFNSHEFIVKLAHQHQAAYVRALAHYADTNQPFKVVHSRLAKMLDERYSHLVHYVGQEPSRDIFGQTSEAALWVKVK